jgi:hypothetical protein
LLNPREKENERKPYEPVLKLDLQRMENGKNTQFVAMLEEQQKEIEKLFTVVSNSKLQKSLGRWSIEST